MPQIVRQMATLPHPADIIIKEEALDSAISKCVRCNGCSEIIADRYFLRVGGSLSWHLNCLTCTACLTKLDTQVTCYCRDSKVYCKHCYSRTFSAKCAGCGRTIQSSDWVRRAKNHVYHLACFACDDCKRQLSTGEEFAMLDSKVLCKAHYLDMIEGSFQAATGKNDSSSVLGSDGVDKRNVHKSKRIRTTFSEEQLEVLQANFTIDSNPDGQDLERIAQQTGLSKRVTQVGVVPEFTRTPKEAQRFTQRYVAWFIVG
ncbi:LIM/homeobox protein Awh-like isoform X2 [Acanthaster planci]|uniref:LIM/homeobox protein Awh-like isoform X2 n=1 Tax=Acanthaster planci TaxID=133434 RepID=A0A8B7YUB9_ACAPL|nr:LIM/homeobox protein Awh-like isoform X2 [Acanthaster planci]